MAIHLTCLGQSAIRSCHSSVQWLWFASSRLVGHDGAGHALRSGVDVPTKLDTLEKSLETSKTYRIRRHETLIVCECLSRCPRQTYDSDFYWWTCIGDSNLSGLRLLYFNGWLFFFFGGGARFRFFCGFLLCFSCFSAFRAFVLFLLLGFSASLLFRFLLFLLFCIFLLLSFLLFRFLLFLLPCFCACLLLCLSLFCFSAFTAFVFPAFLLFCFCAFLLLLLFLFFSHVFLLLYFLLFCFSASFLYCLFVFHFLLLYSLLFVS